jgi:hypothetical protein
VKRTSAAEDGTLGLTLEVVKEQVNEEYERLLQKEFSIQVVELLQRYDAERKTRGRGTEQLETRLSPR